MTVLIMTNSLESYHLKYHKFIIQSFFYWIFKYLFKAKASINEKL